MDPYEATRRFLATMVENTPNWFDVEEAIICQNTQQSQFDGKIIDPKTEKPYPFAQNYKDREDQTNRLEEDVLFFTNGGK